jgi:hypothetical protein
MEKQLFNDKRVWLFLMLINLIFFNHLRVGLQDENLGFLWAIAYIEAFFH